MSDQLKYRCSMYRGGTSKALFFKENELPQDRIIRDKMLLAAYGSPDVRQIDGLGGSDITTSKVAIIGPPSRNDADIDYTFGQVSIKQPVVSYQGNCGNISSAVGPYAVDEGLVRTSGNRAKVRIHNTNTNKILVAEFPVSNGKTVYDDNYSIPGVPGTGPMIKLNFADTAGSSTGKLLPTGNVVDTLEVEGVGEIEVSIVDAANPVVFVRASDVGTTGKENRLEINNNEDLLAKLEQIRARGAKAAGIVKDHKKAEIESPLVPQIAFVTASQDYCDYVSGKTIKKSAVSFLSRVIFNQMAVETYTGTGSICTAAATMISGTLVNSVASKNAKKTGIVCIGHPRGAMEIEVQVEKKQNEYQLKKAIFRRTARRLFEGYVFVKKSTIE